MAIQQPYNVTFTNNRFIDATWVQEQNGFIMGTRIVSCEKTVYYRDIFENNTFINTLKRERSQYPIQNFHEIEGQPVVHDVIFRNNVFINHTFGLKGMIFIYKIDIVSLSVTFENNYFENITNIAPYPVFLCVAGNI